MTSFFFFILIASWRVLFDRLPQYPVGVGVAVEEVEEEEEDEVEWWCSAFVLGLDFLQMSSPSQ
jgi:hypothetical protein